MTLRLNHVLYKLVSCHHTVSWLSIWQQKYCNEAITKRKRNAALQTVKEQSAYHPISKRRKTGTTVPKPMTSLVAHRRKGRIALNVNINKRHQLDNGHKCMTVEQPKTNLFWNTTFPNLLSRTLSKILNPLTLSQKATQQLVTNLEPLNKPKT